MSEHDYIIDLDGVGTEEELQERIEESLPLPDYYGDNLDALYDVLTEYGEGWHIIIVNRDTVDEDMKPYVEDMIDTIEDASAVAADLTVEYDEDDDVFDGEIE